MLAHTTKKEPIGRIGPKSREETPEMGTGPGDDCIATSPASN